MQIYALRNPRWREDGRVPLGSLATVFVYLSNGGAGVVTHGKCNGDVVAEVVIEKVRVRSKSVFMRS